MSRGSGPVPLLLRAARPWLAIADGIAGLDLVAKRQRLSWPISPAIGSELPLAPKPESR